MEVRESDEAKRREHEDSRAGAEVAAGDVDQELPAHDARGREGSRSPNDPSS